MYNLTHKRGTLFNENNATFAVNPSNTQLILGSGVSMAFKRECGFDLQHIMNEALLKVDGTLQQGDVIATAPGISTKFKIALHVAVMNYDEGTSRINKLPTLQVISDALHNIEGYLKWYATFHNENIKLVMPMIGCGTGGLNITEVAQIYKDFFSRDIDFNCEVIVYHLNTNNLAICNSI